MKCTMCDVQRKWKPRELYVWQRYFFISRPMDRSKRFTLFDLPGRPVHSDTNSASLWSILVMQQLRSTTKSLTFPPLSIDRYSFIQLSELCVVRAHVHTCVCMCSYDCVIVCVCVCVHARARVRACERVCARTYVRAYVCACVRACVYVCEHSYLIKH